MTTEVCLIRHAHPNQDGAFTAADGRSDPPLSRLGRAQAVAVGERLAAHSWHQLVSSPLVRARETAEAIAGACRLTVRSDDRWAELHRGDLETAVGKAREAADRSWRSGRWDRWPNGEDRPSFQRRVVAGLRGLSDAGRDARILVVTHWGVINELLRLVLARDAVAAPFHVDNTGLVRLLIGRDTLTVLGVNDVWHLDDPLTTTATAEPEQRTEWPCVHEWLSN